MKRELNKIREENAALARKVQASRERFAETENCIAMAVDEWKVRVIRSGKGSIHKNCIFTIYMFYICTYVYIENK